MKQDSQQTAENYLMLLELANEDLEDPPNFYNFLARYSEAKSVKPPNWMSNNAKRGLAIREKAPKSQKCCLPTGLTRANQLTNKNNLSLKTLKRMKSFASRHGGQLTKEDSSGKTKRGQAMLIWGVTPTKAGVDRFTRWVDSQIGVLENL